MIPAAIRLWDLNALTWQTVGGFIVMQAFVIFRFVALKNLGGNFSYELAIRDNHKLVTNGVYNILRHPLHLAFWGEVLGMAIMAGSVAGYVFTLLLVPLIVYRNGVEDAALEEKFGDEFVKYKRRVPSIDIVTGIIKAWKR